MDENSNDQTEMTENRNSEVEAKQAILLRRRLHATGKKIQLGLQGWVGYTSSKGRKELVVLH